jgi:hypothetical protein
MGQSKVSLIFKINIGMTKADVQDFFQDLGEKHVVSYKNIVYIDMD